MNRTAAFRLNLLIGILLACLALEFAKPALKILIIGDQKADFTVNYGFAVGRQNFGMDFMYHETYVRRSGLEPFLYDVFYPDVSGGYRYYHPPASILSLYWVRWIPESASRGVWGLLVFLGIFLISLMWLRAASRRAPPGTGIHTSWGPLCLAAGLLTLSYPSIFSFERGNTDLIILGTMSAAAWCLAGSRWTLLGFMIGAAVLIKLYPATVAAPVGLLAGAAIIKGATAGNMRWVGRGLRIGIGALLSLLAIAAPLWPLYKQYLTKVLPSYGPRYVNTPECSYCHSLSTAFDIWGVGFFVIPLAAGGFVLLRSFLSIADKRSEVGIKGTDSGLMDWTGIRAFCFLTALSVYLAQISYDYNLIMAIPLIAVQAFSGGKGRIPFIGSIGLAVYAVGVFLPRWTHELLMTGASWSPYLVIQCAGLTLIAADLIAARSGPDTDQAGT